jgi:SAM-dependent methyltransferase
MDGQPLRDIHVAASNAEQAAAWDGDEGAYWDEHARRFDEAIARHHERFLGVLDLAANSQVLDVGCGTGQSTRDSARRAPAGWALGVDLSARMLHVARREAAREGLHNVTFEQTDAQIHPFPTAGFDLVIARTAAMFFGDKPTAFANLARTLRPHGQLAMLVWQTAPRNEWVSCLMNAMAAGRDLPQPRPDGPHPFSLADPNQARELLDGTGFTNITFAAVEESMYFGHNSADAFKFVLGMLGWMLHNIDDSTRDQALSSLRRTLDDHERTDGVWYDSAAWIITARRGD